MSFFSSYDDDAFVCHIEKFLKGKLLLEILLIRVWSCALMGIIKRNRRIDFEPSLSQTMPESNTGQRENDTVCDGDAPTLNISDGIFVSSIKKCNDVLLNRLVDWDRHMKELLFLFEIGNEDLNRANEF